MNMNEEQKTLVEDLLSKEKHNLIKKMREALQHAPIVEVINGAVTTEEHLEQLKESDELPEGVMRFVGSNQPNEVYLDEQQSHLFPWFYREARQQIGIDKDVELEKDVASHEFAHLARAMAASNLQSRIGIAYYRVRKIDGKALPNLPYALIPLVTATGKCLIEEYEDIKAAPGDDMSEQDKQDLKKIQKYK